MCEFKVYIGDKQVFEGVCYVQVKGDKIVLRNIIGDVKEVQGCKIVEIDVPSERLVLAEEAK